METREIPIDDIRTDGGTQIRADLNWLAVDEYAHAMSQGATFPPVTVFCDADKQHWLADGFHRVDAAKRAGRDRVLAEIRAGSKTHAILHACGANTDHGVRRTNADKRNAVERLIELSHENGEGWSDNEIAKRARVSQPFVSKILSYNDYKIGATPRTVTRGGVTYQMDVSAIGKSPDAAPEGDRELAFEMPALEASGNGVPFASSYEPARENRNVHVANNSGNNEWYTPMEYIEMAREVMGGIDLDPASSEMANETVGASKYFTVDDDGLAQCWAGRVWMNPPYSAGLVDAFAAKLVSEYTRGAVDEAIVLVNNATETKWFQGMAIHCSAICFLGSRVRFWSPDSRVGAPLQGQAVLYMGDYPDRFSDRFYDAGFVVRVSA